MQELSTRCIDSTPLARVFARLPSYPTIRSPWNSGRPGRAPVCLPPSMTTTPLTIVYGMPAGIALRLLERVRLADRRRIEDRDVGGKPFANLAAIAQAENLRRQRRHLANGVFERQHLLVAHVVAEHARDWSRSCAGAARPPRRD